MSLEALDAWVLRVVEAVRSGGGREGHPHEILSTDVSTANALTVAKETFLRLIAKLEGRGTAYLMVAVGEVPVSVGKLDSKVAEVESRGLEAFVHDQLDVAVAADSGTAQYRKGVEVATVPLDSKVFKLDVQGGNAYIRGMREEGDDEWSVDAVLRVG